MAQQTVMECVPYLLALSDEVLVMIFSLLNTQDKISLSKVCPRFDRVLMDNRLCRNVIISPDNEESCLDHIGLYFRRRRQRIHSLNINSCLWIPLAKVTLMAKSLPNLVCLNMMNITLPVKNLASILKESKQLRELSWSWYADGKSMTWSEVPSNERMGLAGLERLHVSLPNPWCMAARELYGFCHGLSHLTVEVYASSQHLPEPKTRIGENLSGPSKLKSLVVWRNACFRNVSYERSIDDSIGEMLKHFWINCGGFLSAWECLWTNAYNHIPWRNETSPTQFSIVPKNLKSIVIDSTYLTSVRSELSVSQLIINVPSGEKVANFPPLIAIAPKLQEFGIISNEFSMELNSWINAAIGSSGFLTEINLFGVHYCGDYYGVEKLWLALKSLRSLKKLAVAPCVMPRIEYASKVQPMEEKKYFVVHHSQVADVNKKISELLGPYSLEIFEVGNPPDTSVDKWCYRATWIPHVAAISVWSKLSCLTIDSIASLRSLYQFKLVALYCKELTKLRFRNLGPKGYCGYVKDVAASLPYCQALKHFRLDQPCIFDLVKDLLVSLSHCKNLETIIITNYEVVCSGRLKRKVNFTQMLLHVADSCLHLTLMLITLPDVTMPICKRIKSEILKRTIHPRKSSLVLEFCSYPIISGPTQDTYHEFPKFPCHYGHYDELHMLSNVALPPPLKHIR